MRIWFQRMGNRISRYFWRSTVQQTAETKLDDLTHSIDLDPLDIEPPELEQEDTAVSACQVIGNLTTLLLSPDNRLRITAASILAGLGIGMNFLSPYIFGASLQSLSPDQRPVKIAGIELPETVLMVMLVSLYTLSQIIPNLREQILAPVGTKNTQKTLEQALNHILLQPLDYHINTPIGDMIYFIQKSFSLSILGTALLTKIIPAVFEIATACTILSALYGWEIGLGMMGLLVSYTGYSIFTAKPIIKTREKQLEAENAMWGSVWGTIRNFKLMQDCGHTVRDMNKAHQVLSHLSETQTQSITLPLKIELGHILQSRSIMFLAIFFMSLRVHTGQLTIQQFTVLTAYLNQLSQTLPGFGQALNQFFSLYPDARFFFNELKRSPIMIDSYPDISLTIAPGTAPLIEFENVSFRYPTKRGEAPKPFILRNFSCIIPAGRQIALVSESGAGKSTLFNLLFRYYIPTEGIIKINGQDINRVSLKSLRAAISLFGQSANLFQGSVRLNICYGNANPDEISDEQILATARTANLYDFLRELNLDTEVGEYGKALSGGQQQKVAVLRGLLKKGSIRLYDEITAPFDGTSATEVLQGIRNASAHTTSLMITHKLAEIVDVDYIIVIDKGRVLAQGTHEELLEHCELYQKLWSACTAQSATDESSTARAQPTTSIAPLSIFRQQRTTKRQGDTIVATPALQ